MRVSITQFMRPNGRQVLNYCDVDDSLAEKYKLIQEAGLRLTAEVLMTGMISQTLEHRDGDFRIELCQNEPNAPKKALEKLIASFDKEQFTKWLKELEG